MFVNLELWHFRRAVRVGLIEDWGNRWPKGDLSQIRKQRFEIWKAGMHIRLDGNQQVGRVLG